MDVPTCSRQVINIIISVIVYVRDRQSYDLLLSLSNIEKGTHTQTERFESLIKLLIFLI